MSATVVLVARRELVQRFRGKAWYVSTAIAVLAVLTVGLVARFVNLDDRVGVDVVVVDAPPQLVELLPQLGDVTNYDVDVTTAPDRGAAIGALEDGDADVAIVTTDDGAAALYPDDIDTELQPFLQQVWASAAVQAGLADAGLSAEEIAGIVGSDGLVAESIDPDGSEDEDDLATLIGMFSSIALFIAVQIYGSYILMGVVEEKATAVVEVLLARVRATQLLTGKVIGIGLVALAQLTIIVTCAVVALAISGVEIPSELWTALPTMLVWFVGGFGMYSFLYAMAGAMVSRQEDAQAAATPVTILLMAVYMTVFIFAFDPSLTAARVLSLIPPFTPLIMPLRVAAGEVSLAEALLSIAGMALATALVAIYAGRIYTNLVLRRGARVGWTEALRSTRA